LGIEIEDLFERGVLEAQDHGQVGRSSGGRPGIGGQQSGLVGPDGGSSGRGDPWPAEWLARNRQGGVGVGEGGRCLGGGVARGANGLEPGGDGLVAGWLGGPRWGYRGDGHGLGRLGGRDEQQEEQGGEAALERFGVGRF
jgi:hypothetical protein